MRLPGRYDSLGLLSEAAAQSSHSGFRGGLEIDVHDRDVGRDEADAPDLMSLRRALEERRKDLPYITMPKSVQRTSGP
jgi:hypothetical protein